VISLEICRGFPPTNIFPNLDKMTAKERKGFLSLFGLGKKNAEKADKALQQKLFYRHRQLGSSGYRTELYIGKFHCGHCNKKEMDIRRSTLPQGAEFSEELRFEQSIEKKTGSLVLPRG
jgi:hypothetical protein